MIVGVVKEDGEVGGPHVRSFLSNFGTPTIGTCATPKGIKRKLGHELPQVNKQIGESAPPKDQDNSKLGTRTVPTIKSKELSVNIMKIDMNEILKNTNEEAKEA